MPAMPNYSGSSEQLFSAWRMQETSDSLPVIVLVSEHSSCVFHFAVSFALGLRFVLRVTASALMCYRTNNR